MLHHPVGVQVLGDPQFALQQAQQQGQFAKIAKHDPHKRG